MRHQPPPQGVLTQNQHRSYDEHPGASTLLLTTLASAQTLTGSVKNSTTGKPSAGDDVVLLSLGQGMEEAGRTKTDAKGAFSFKLAADGPHLVRVIHQEVTYHRMAPPGTTSVEVEVYDVAKKVDGIQVVADIMTFQASQGQLHVQRTFAVNNVSKPPRTQMNEHNLEFYVPDGAAVSEGQAMTAGGQPVNSAPVPEGANAKNRYAFLFPLRPGETRFSVVYSVPYTGSVNIDPKSIYPLEHFVVIAPKVMEFSAAPGAHFEVAPYPGQPDANVEVSSNTRPGQTPRIQVEWRRHPGSPCRRRQRRSADPRRAKPSPKAAPAADSDRPSTLPTLCRNIAGGFSADSPPSSSSAESSSPAASNPPTAPPAPKASPFPNSKTTKTTSPKKFPSAANFEPANRA